MIPAPGRGPHRVDYDRIAPLYDEPGRDHVPDPNLIAFLEAATDVDTSAFRILDIGCGTGKQLAANRGAFPGMAMVGVDRFAGMLGIAQRRAPDVAWVLADGASLPLAADAFHYATSQFSYPHIRATASFLREVFRTLRPGGRFVMTNIDPWSMPGWLIYRYFPEALALDRADFVPAERFATGMQDAGFRNVEVVRADRSSDERLDAFRDFVAERHRASQLMAIADDAYRAGIERVAAATRDGSIARSEFVLVTISGDKAHG